MTTPEDRDQGAQAPAWGQQPAGGWGDAGSETRAWGGAPAAGDEATRVDQPRPADDEATRVDQPRPQPGRADETRQWAPDPQAPAWAQQPPPGAGWAGGAPQQPQWGPPPQQGGGQWGPPTQQGWGPPGQQPGPWGPPGQQQPPPQHPAQWGPGYPPLPGAGGAPRRRSTKLPLIIGGVVVALLAIGAVLAFVTPGFLRTTVFDQAQLQAGVQRVLTEDYRYTGVGEVRCGTTGEIIRVETGAEFTCSTTIDGAPATIPVRVTSDTGDYEVSRPL